MAYTGRFGTDDSQLGNILLGSEGEEATSQTFTADAVIQASRTSSFTADAAVALVQSATFTADAVLQRSQTTSFTADAVIQSSRASSFTADAIIGDPPTTTFTGRLGTDDSQLANIVLGSEGGEEETPGSASFTADAVLQAVISTSLTADAVVSVLQSVSFTSDAAIVLQQTTSFTADAVVQVVISTSFTADAIIVATVSATFSADAAIGFTGSSSFTADAVLAATPTASFSGDAVIQTDRSSSFTADARIVGIATTAFQPNAFQNDDLAFQIFLGANATFTANAVIQAVRSTSFTANAVLAIQPTQTFTADAVIVQALFTADAIISIERSATFTANAIVRADQSASFAADAILGFTLYVTADAVLQATVTTSFLADAQISAPPDEVYGEVPDGYEPQLAAPIDDTQTTITVTNPLPDGTELPILVYIDGEWVLVTAVSLDGLTWTVVRGVNTSTASSHGISTILPANTTVSVGGVQVGPDVNFTRTKLTTYSNGKPGTGEVWIRDLDRVHSFTTGAEVIVRYRNIRVWGGFVMGIRRAHVFPEGSGNLATEPRYLILQVVDYNILFERRIYYRKTDPAFMPVRRWANGYDDDAVISDIVTYYLDIGNDHLNFDVHHVGTPGLPQISCNPDAPDNFQLGSAGWRWGDVMNAIVSQTGAVYYIDPDKTFRYVDDSTKQSVFGYDGLSDTPSGTMTGYRDFELVNDGSELVNEQFTWGVGQGATAPVLGHATDDASVAEHGLWQGAELRYDMYCQDTVDLRAETWLSGSPQNHRGHKDDKVSIRATVFHPYFRVADVLLAENTTFGFSDDIPVRGAEITFPTPWSIQMVLTISHEIDQPWNIFEFYFPDFNFGFPPFEIPPFDGFIFPPFNECDPGLACVETFTRSVADGAGAAEVPAGYTWTDGSDNFYVNGSELVIYRPEVDTTPRHIDLPYSTAIPFDITFTGRWEKDEGVEPGPPHGSNVSEAYGLARFVLWSPESGDNLGDPYKRPREYIGFRLNRDSDTSEDFLSFPLDGDGLSSGDNYTSGGFVPDFANPYTSWKARWRIETNNVYLKVWDATEPEPVSWSQTVARPSALSAAVTGYPMWAFDTLLGNETPSLTIGFVQGVRLKITEYRLNECDDPCAGGCDTPLDTLTSEAQIAAHSQYSGKWHRASGGALTWTTSATEIDPRDSLFGSGEDDRWFIGLGKADATSTPHLPVGTERVRLVGTVYFAGSLISGFPDVGWELHHGNWGNVTSSLTRPTFDHSAGLLASGTLVVNGDPDTNFYSTGPIDVEYNLAANAAAVPVAQLVLRVLTQPEQSFHQNVVYLQWSSITACPAAIDLGDFDEPPDQGTVYGRSPESGVELDNGNFLYCFGIQFQYSSSEVWADGYRLRLNDDYIEHALEGCIEILSTANAGPNPFDSGMSVTANFTPWLIQDPPPDFVP